MQKLFLPILLFCCFSDFAQTDSVMYTKDFIFKDGIYITLQDFKNNNPPLTPANFKKYNPEVDYFGEKLSGPQVKKRSLNFPINEDSVSNIFSNSIFAYVINNIPYILNAISPLEPHLRIVPDSKNYKIKEVNFYKFFKMGKLCLIYSEQKNIRYNKDTISKNLVSIEEIFNDPDPVQSTGFYDPNNHTWSPGNNVPKLPSMSLSILSFDTGNIYKFKLNKFSYLLEKKDNELFNEFSKLSKSKQEDMMFIYLNKLNERKPIYFKVNN